MSHRIELKLPPETAVFISRNVCDRPSCASGPSALLSVRFERKTGMSEAIAAKPHAGTITAPVLDARQSYLEGAAHK